MGLATAALLALLLFETSRVSASPERVLRQARHTRRHLGSSELRPFETPTDGRLSAADITLLVNSGALPSLSPPPPPSSLSPPSSRPPPTATALSASQAALVKYMVTLGFSTAEAQAAVEATQPQSEREVHEKAQPWSLRRRVEANRAEFASEREVVSFDHMDMDGYALRWGSDHIALSLADCGRRCLELMPEQPYYMPCNVFVFCPLEMCFAPAQLPKGSRQGWCWLKNQPDPTAPQVNMNGTDRRTQTGFVEWQAGVVVKKGSRVRTDIKSARASW